MYKEDDMNKALRAFDWSAPQALLQGNSIEDLRKLVSDVSRSGCLLRLYKLSAQNTEARKEMIEHIRTLCSNPQTSEAAQHFEFVLQQVDITEMALSGIDDTFQQDEYAQLNSADQAWALIVWAASEMLDVHRQMLAALDVYRSGDVIVIDPLHCRLDKEHGYASAGGRIYQISQTLANTLRMLGHLNERAKSRRFAVPERSTPTPKMISSAARISRLGDFWEAVVAESKHHRFWGGYFEIRNPNDEQLEFSPELAHVIESVKTERDRRDDCQISEYIALNRMQRSQISTFQHIAKTNARKRVKNPRVENVSLAPIALVSELEMVTLYTLDVTLHLNPIKSRKEYGGLRLLEWLRGYCILEACYTEKETAVSGGLIELEREEIIETLVRGGLTQSKARIFLERVTFQAGRRDLYDAPLFPVTNGQLFFLEALYHGVDLAIILLSQIGSQKLNLDGKGEAFEKAILQMFEDLKIPARTFKFKIGDKNKGEEKEYQCDVAVLWGRNLFVIECKNYGLPRPDPADRLYFWQKQAEAMLQVERIANDLSEHPEYIRMHFGAEAQWDHVHPVVLNASFLSLKQSSKGTFFYDASALGRFLKEGTVNEIHSVPADGQRIELSFEMKQLWKGSQPTAEDLLNEMRLPSQIQMELDQYYIACTLIPISRDVAVMIAEAASKPPDFEPLEASREKEGHSISN